MSPFFTLWTFPFKIDTGAKVTVTSEQTLSSTALCKLSRIYQVWAYSQVIHACIAHSKKLQFVFVHIKFLLCKNKTGLGTLYYASSATINTNLKKSRAGRIASFAGQKECGDTYMSIDRVQINLYDLCFYLIPCK